MSSKDTRSARAVSLEDRIAQLRADIEAIISARVEVVAKESPGVPIGVIRNLLTAGAPACSCAQYLELNRERREIREFVAAE
jgi:hypothetical protein